MTALDFLEVTSGEREIVSQAHATCNWMLESQLYKEKFIGT